MGTDNFGGGISLDPLGARISTHHMTLWVKHVDGVIDHALNEQLFRVGPKLPRIRHIETRSNAVEELSAPHVGGYNRSSATYFPAERPLTLALSSFLLLPCAEI
jgi:hypothetical protein